MRKKNVLLSGPQHPPKWRELCAKRTYSCQDHHTLPSGENYVQKECTPVRTTTPSQVERIMRKRNILLSGPPHPPKWRELCTKRMFSCQDPNTLPSGENYPQKECTPVRTTTPSQKDRTFQLTVFLSPSAVKHHSEIKNSKAKLFNCHFFGGEREEGR